jgi:hypothetical protein
LVAWRRRPFAASSTATCSGSHSSVPVTVRSSRGTETFGDPGYPAILSLTPGAALPHAAR